MRPPEEYGERKRRSYREAGASSVNKKCCVNALPKQGMQKGVHVRENRVIWTVV